MAERLRVASPRIPLFSPFGDSPARSQCEGWFSAERRERLDRQSVNTCIRKPRMTGLASPQGRDDSKKEPPLRVLSA